MHRSEEREFGVCASCGATTGLQERAFVFGAEGLLCFECASKRGGSYDEYFDRWTARPRVDDLVASAQA